MVTTVPTITKNQWQGNSFSVKKNSRLCSDSRAEGKEGKAQSAWEGSRGKGKGAEELQRRLDSVAGSCSQTPSVAHPFQSRIACIARIDWCPDKSGQKQQGADKASSMAKNYQNLPNRGRKAKRSQGWPTVDHNGQKQPRSSKKKPRMDKVAKKWPKVVGNNQNGQNSQKWLSNVTKSKQKLQEAAKRWPKITKKSGQKWPGRPKVATKWPKMAKESKKWPQQQLII